MGNKYPKFKREHPRAKSVWYESGMNHALVFIKPHACNSKVEKFVRDFLIHHGIRIDKTETKTSEKLRHLIDEHYGTISKAALSTHPKELRISDREKFKFKEAFGEEWDEALKSQKVLNAKMFESKAPSERSIGELWDQNSTKAVGLTPGVKIARIHSRSSQTEEEQVHYVINGFYNDMRSQYLEHDAKVICFRIHFREEELSWHRFRQDIIGSTNPKGAKAGSLRAEILAKWKELGLDKEPDYTHNGVHASAGPIEGLFERLLWFGTKLEEDPFGTAMLRANVQREIIDYFLDNREITLYGETNTTFNFTEELDSSDVIERALQLQEDMPELLI